MEDTLVPLDATLFNASLGKAFGLPGFGTTTTARGGPPPPPPASASWAGSLQHQQQGPFGAGAGSKPVAIWGGAAKEELLRRSTQQQQQQQQQHQQHQQQLPSFPLLQPELPLPAVQQSAVSGMAGLSVGSSGQHQQQLLQQQRSSFDSGMAAALQQQRSSLEAAQQRPSFESVVAAAQHRPSFESVVAAAQQRSSFEEGVAAAMQQQQQQQQQQRSSFEQQQRASFEGGVAASNQLFQAQQFMAAQASFPHQHLNSIQQSVPLQSFNPFGPLQMPGGLDFTQQGLLAGCPPAYCKPPPYQQQPVGHASSTGTTGTDMTEEDDEQGSARTVKRARLVWTPQLHKRFEEAVEKLGHEKAVPKNIMQEMNIEGLTRENVASHLQKWRLLEKKNGRGSTEGRTDASC
ncbi:hypothetical protein DUNSADRAFT_13048 [Dunaliella salina]|uniref:HTH myb-type domain-containing protein n=1 Tax=Dunaliella salina TaxID=3046 RepID=A0ABQ7GA63_DUNSA|nr:hypothetical protein DUNSADRAFT_13048 [Dunaliella salina]|eukprot:KAF5831490.1 hypothetical protein DUNSADRAFT_13048 [Dunaliella salina]